MLMSAASRWHRADPASQKQRDYGAQQHVSASLAGHRQSPSAEGKRELAHVTAGTGNSEQAGPEIRLNPTPVGKMYRGSSVRVNTKGGKLCGLTTLYVTFTVVSSSIRKLLVCNSTSGQSQQQCFILNQMNHALSM